MFARQWNHRMVRVSILVALLTFGILGVRSSVAGDPAKLDTSLKLIPADAAFYSTMLRNRERVEAIAKSKAWAKIVELPVVQMGISLYSMQAETPGTGPANFEEALKNPETRKIIDLLADMASDEMFAYGGKNFGDFVELFQTVNAAQSIAPLIAQLNGQTAPEEMSKVQTGAVLAALAKNTKLIGVPDLIFGFKIKNAELAKEQLIKLETIANIVLEMNEKTQGRFKKTKVGNHEYLVVKLDGAMIPWDEVPMEKMKDAETTKGDAQKVIDRVKKTKLVIALGLRDNYLVAAIGPSLDALENLEKGDRLMNRAEFKPFAKYADKRLVSIGYASEAFNRQISDSQQKSIDQLLVFLDEALPKTSLTDAQKERVRKDAQSFKSDLNTLIPKAGAAMGLGFLTDQGVEGYGYSWSENRSLDGTQPLSLLQHVGGDPLFGLVTRQKFNPKDYDLVVKWAKTAYSYFEEIGLPLMAEKERVEVKKFLADALPLVARFDKANREMLIPALADGQVAIVVDGKLTSAHFIESLPATQKPMPMVEPALVFGVSDSQLLMKSFTEYREITNGLIGAVRKIEGVELPKEIKIPEAQVTQSAGAKVYSFPLPKDWGVDKNIVPTIAISDKVAVFSISQAHCERLLKATPLAVGGLLDKSDRPLAAAVWFRWAGLLDAAGPWVDFAVEQATAMNAEDGDGKQAIADQVHTVVDVLKAMRTITNETYTEDGALVNHTLVEVHDIDK
jgi:hypothetical protein